MNKTFQIKFSFHEKSIFPNLVKLTYFTFCFLFFTELLNAQCLPNAIDSDNDGICDAMDICINLDDNLIGSACNDGNDCTINDVYINCKCIGVALPDADNDGLCDLIDACVNFSNAMDIDSDDIPDCIDACIDVDMDNICDANDNSVLVDELKIYFSHERGFYNNVFNLTIKSNDPSASIRYSNTAQNPTSSTGILYNGSIPINTTEIIKAIAYNSTDTTDLIVHSYFFISNIINQAQFSGHITNDAIWGPMMDESLLSIPSISLNYEGTTSPLEIPVSFEFIDPTTGDHTFANAGVELFGGGSLQSSIITKKNHRIHFRGVYGVKNLKYPLFDGFESGIEAVTKFDKLDLRSSHDSWEYPNNLPNFIGTKYLDDFMLASGGINPHNRPVHVYLNGTYWGIYSLREKFDAKMVSSYYDDDDNSDLYDDVARTATHYFLTGTLKSGTGNSWNNMLSQVSNYEEWKKLVNTDNFFDLMILGNTFDQQNEWNASGSSQEGKGFLFNFDDADLLFVRDYGERISGGGPNNIFGDLQNTGLAFKRDFADRLYKHFEFEEGLLDLDNFKNNIDELAELVELPLVAESARWGDLNENPTVWQSEIDRIKNIRTPVSIPESFIEFKSVSLYPDLEAVQTNHINNSVLDNNSTITLVNPNPTGVIYYTLDGTDPIDDDEISIRTQAILYTAPITLNNGVHKLFARVFDVNQILDYDKWSATCPRTYYVNQNYNDIVINEIHYNPEDSIIYIDSIAMNDTIDGKNFEFIELKNKGTQAVNLLNSKFTKGIEFLIEKDLNVLPDSFLVFAEDAFWFEQKYGFQPDGVFIGKLDNGGEKINLKNPQGYFIDTVRYNDSNPWDSIPDEGFYSLALIDAGQDNSNASNWSAQSVYTTPRAENKFCPGEIFNNYSVQKPNCAGSADAFISPIVFGGDGGPFNYLWEDGSTSPFRFNLSPGTYYLEINDNSSCYRKDTITIDPTPPVLLNSTSNDQFYFNTADGDAAVTASGGTPPFSYLWSNGQNTATANNLLPGNYTVTVTDANNCSATSSATVLPVDCSGINVNLFDTDMTAFNANDATAVAFVNGGNAPYSFLWSTGETTASIANLAAGTYDVTVTDVRGCIKNAQIEILPYDCTQNNLSIIINSNDETGL